MSERFTSVLGAAILSELLEATPQEIAHATAGGPAQPAHAPRTASRPTGDSTSPSRGCSRPPACATSPRNSSLPIPPPIRGHDYPSQHSANRCHRKPGRSHPGSAAGRHRGDGALPGPSRQCRRGQGPDRAQARRAWADPPCPADRDSSGSPPTSSVRDSAWTASAMTHSPRPGCLRDERLACAVPGIRSGHRARPVGSTLWQP